MEFKRVDIKTGFLCNNNCLFCVQAYRKKYGNRPTEDIKEDLRKARMNNCQGVVFTGGEVTIRKDVFDLVSFAKKLGFSSIQIQTNGRMLSYKWFCKKIIEAGANEFAPALHGHNAELHDYLTRAEGSFDQTVKAIRNLKELGQNVLTNTVVVRPNYRYLPDIARLLVDLNVDQFQFAFMHAVGNAELNYDKMMPKVSLAVPYIKEGLQIGLDNNIKVMVEAVPFCLMKGYERYCSEFYIPKTEIRDIDRFDPAFELTRKKEGKTKFPKCKTCRYDLLCEGPWKEYPAKMGDDEFHPVPGKLLGFKDLFPEKLETNSLAEKSISLKNKKPRITLLWTLYSPPPGKILPSLSIAYLSKYLEQNGFEVNCIDCNLLVYNKWDYSFVNFDNKKKILGKLIREVEKTEPDILGAGFWQEGISFVREFLDIYKKRNPQVKLVIGGTLSSLLPDKVMEFIPAADYLIRGEGELTLLELSKMISQNRKVSNVLGLSLRKSDGKIFHNPSRPFVRNLDLFPLMDFENFKYLPSRDQLTIVSSRGCPCNCSYCFSNKLCSVYRYHSPEYVVRQVKHLIDLYGVRTISFSDDNVFCNRDRAKKILESFAKENFDCDFPSSSRADYLNEEIMSLLKKANVPWLTIGVENIVPKILRFYNRTLSHQDYIRRVHKSVDYLKDNGLGGAFSFVLGSPISTREDINQNISFMESLVKKGFWIYASILRPVPGSRLWDAYIKKDLRLFNLHKKSSFIFEKGFENIPWVCPQNFSFENENYSNQEFMNICDQVMRKVSFLLRNQQC